MEDETEKLLQNLVLTEEEDKVVKINPEHTKANESKGQYCLVGRTLSRRPINMEAMENTLSMAWGVSKGFSCKPLKENIFLFIFKHVVDKQRALRNGP
ncbi:hypothetical protein U1Q18_027731 [Sarracenia purpurea var. burkii]